MDKDSCSTKRSYNMIQKVELETKQTWAGTNQGN